MAQGGINGGGSIIGNAAINRLIVEFDRVGSRIGFGERSSTECAAPCAAFLSNYGCTAAQCTWAGSSCTGGTGRGNAAAGSTVLHFPAQFPPF